MRYGDKKLKNTICVGSTHEVAVAMNHPMSTLLAIPKKVDCTAIASAYLPVLPERAA